MGCQYYPARFTSVTRCRLRSAWLGKYVVRMLDGQALVARITETEAYVGRMDKAAHAYNYRQTARNAAMFGPPGHAYVYMIYGMHHCLNFVTEPEGEPSAVLLRGLEPVYGLDEMARLRFGKTWDALTRTQRRNITNGPGKCCRALAIDRALNTADLAGEELFVCTSPADAGLPEVTPRTIPCTPASASGSTMPRRQPDFRGASGWKERTDKQC